MTNIKYVTEYLPSSAKLSLGQQFYKTSKDDEKISVGVQVALNPLYVVVPLVAVGALIGLYFLTK